MLVEVRGIDSNRETCNTGGFVVVEAGSHDVNLNVVVDLVVRLSNSHELMNLLVQNDNATQLAVVGTPPARNSRLTGSESALIWRVVSGRPDSGRDQQTIEHS